MKNTTIFLRTHYFFLLCFIPFHLFYAQSTQVSNFAGTTGVSGFSDGDAFKSKFNTPGRMAIDVNDNIYIADISNHIIRKITPEGFVSTYAGKPGISGFQDGNASNALFNRPSSVCIDKNGNIYVADAENYKIRKISTSGLVTTYAGSVMGYADGNANNAQFNVPADIVMDSFGNIFVTDFYNNTIRKIDISGNVSTFAGNKELSGFLDGVGQSALFYAPEGIAIDNNDNLYVAEIGNHLIRKITPTGVVTRYAGIPTIRGSNDGNANQSTFYGPTDIVTDSENNLYITERFNHLIRKITVSGVVSTIAGVKGAIAGSENGVGSVSRFSAPFGIIINSKK